MGAAEGVIDIRPEDRKEWDRSKEVMGKGREPQVGSSAKLFGTICLAEWHCKINIELRLAQRIDLGVPVFWIYRDLTVAIFQIDLEIPGDLG